jgi:hypothetical protein
MNKVTLKEIEQAVIVNPLAAIDLIVEAMSKTNQDDTFPNSSDLLTFFSHAVLLSQNINTDLWENDPKEELFRKEIGSTTRHFIGVCLLRLLASCDKCFQTDPSFRHKVFDLFDDVFLNDLYKSCNITKNDQTYIKESNLKDVVPSIERDISTTIASLSSFDSLSKQTFRRSFMELIMSKKAQIVILPFLPQDSQSSLSIRLNEIFGSIEHYLKAPESLMLQAFEKAREDLSVYLQEVEQYNTKYSREYLGVIIQKLIDLLKQHFESSPASKPALLIIMKLEKKYPISISGISFDLGIYVRNQGPGHAFDVFLSIASDLSVRRSEIYLGHLEPTSIIVDIPVHVVEPMDKAEILGALSWTNFDGTKDNVEFFFEFEGQRTDIDWNSLQENNPYDLEPVSTEDELVGRTDILNKLVAQSNAKSVGSSYIYGQKRVGKTSIAKTLKTRMDFTNATSYHVIYLETGDYKNPDGSITIENLGKRLCREIKRANHNFAQLPIPEFKGALSPFTDFLESVLDTEPDCKILFILDEFDEIPKDLYRRSSIGDAFFHTIRSISGKPSFGFILVGGEKMEYLLSNQGEKLNKFEPARVDYFDREKNWSDFVDLVQRPVSNLLEISDTAFTALYEQSAGNPYFTKLICRSLFKLLVNRRDCHVTQKEVEEATREAVQIVASNSFQHFWEDGIVDTDERIEERTMIRRKVLIALAETLRNHSLAQKSTILEKAVKQGLSERDTEIELQDFVRRQILIVKEDTYQCKVPFFSTWLQERGVREIITRYVDPDLIAKYKKDEEDAYVRPEEIINLLNDKGYYYQGKNLSEERIRAWLNQFSTYTEQRLMFHILQHIIFYDHSTVRTRLNEAHNIVRADSLRYMKQLQRKRDDILVSYIDGPGKSGATYASLYAELADIFKGNVIERGRLKNTLAAIVRRPQEERPHSLVFIDDFIGTGESASKYFRQINAVCGNQLRASNLRIFFITISGFEQGKQKIAELLEEMGLNIRIRVCELLGEEDKCFNNSSKIFHDSLEREIAKNIAYKYGSTIVPDHPLGFGDCQATIAFEDSCPNNTLPIFWSDSNNWIPLFKRD